MIGERPQTANVLSKISKCEETQLVMCRCRGAGPSNREADQASIIEEGSCRGDQGCWWWGWGRRHEANAVSELQADSAACWHCNTYSDVLQELYEVPSLRRNHSEGLESTAYW